MMHPAAISGAVAKPNSSAPSNAPIATSRPVRRPPSTCTAMRSEEHTSELQSLMRISYAVFCLKKKKEKHKQQSNLLETTTKESAKVLQQIQTRTITRPN